MVHDDPMSEDIHPPTVPYLFYDDATEAIAWLKRVFGFVDRYPPDVDGGGRVIHAELVLGDALVMLSDADRVEAGNVRSPKTLGAPSVGVYVRVSDVDAHHDRAKSEGADVTRAPEDQDFGARFYEARDPEGHLWWFWSPVASEA